MKAHLITRQGWLALDKELKYLWKEYRPQITLKVKRPRHRAIEVRTRIRN